MDPITIALMTMGTLGQLFMKDNQTGNSFDQIKRMMTPEWIQNMTNALYKSSLLGPAYAGNLNSINTGSQQAVRGMNSALAQRGLIGSGMGTIAQGVGGSLGALRSAGLRTDMYKTAAQQAQGLAGMQANTLMNTQPRRDAGRDTYAALLALLGDISKMGIKRGPTQTAQLPGTNGNIITGNQNWWRDSGDQWSI